MEKECAAWFHFTVNKFQVLQRFIHPINVRAGLIPSLVMINSAHQMRTSYYLQTAILSCSPIDGNQTASHVRKQAIV
jgi:hypothetical protein